MYYIGSGPGERAGLGHENGRNVKTGPFWGRGSRAGKRISDPGIFRPVVVHWDEPSGRCGSETDSPTGAIEPSPIIQFAKESVHTSDDLIDVFTKSEFLRDFRTIAAENTRGCIVLARPDLVKAVVTKLHRQG